MVTTPSANWHPRYCAARNWRTALGFLAVSVYGVCVPAGRPLEGPLAGRGDSPVFLFLYLLAVVVLVRLLFILRCFRERLVLALGISDVCLGFAALAVPRALAPWNGFVKQVSTLAWILAGLVSVSLLVSSLQHHRAGASGPPGPRGRDRE